MTPQPDPLRARIATRHQESQGPWPEEGHVCLECWQRWPCDATQLAALPVQDEPGLDKLEARLRRIVDGNPLDDGTNLREWVEWAQTDAYAALRDLDAARLSRATPARLRDYPTGHPGDVDRADCDCDCHIPGEDMDPADCDHCTGMSEQERATSARLGAASEADE